MNLKPVCVLLLAIAGCDTFPSEVEFQGLEMRPGPYVLLDDYLFESSDGVQRTVHTPVRDPAIPNPVVTGVEDQNSTPYLSVLRDDGRFRMWYNAPVDDKGTDQSLLAYIESSDGVHWDRPHRILDGPPGGIRFGVSVIRRPEGGYALGYHQNGGLKVATSSDGFEWELVQPKELIKHNHDISGLAYDPIRERYVAVVSTMRTLSTGGPVHLNFRQTQLSVSENLLDWETPWDVLVTDNLDEEQTQFYGLDGFLPRGQLMIGMVKVLRDDLTAEGGVGGMGWTTLAWSRDGRNWERDRAIYFAPDPQLGTWDHAHAWVDEQVVVGDSVYLYYGGYGEGHKSDRNSDRQIGLVRIARDRYVSWGAGTEGGMLRTRLLRLNGSRLTFNVDAVEGEMRVQIVDLSGNSLVGECDPITGDHLEAELRCDGDIASVHEPVRLKIELRNAELFAFTLEG